MGTTTATVLTVFAIILFAFIVFVLFKKKPIKNVFYQSYKKDELIRTKKTTNSTNYLYFTNGQTLQYIKKYVLCVSRNDQYVICNYARKFENMVYYIICYNEHLKPVSVLKCVEDNCDYSSHIVPLPKNTKHVNIIVGKVNDKVINSNVIKPINIRTIKKYSLLTSLAFLTGTFALVNLMILAFGGVYTRYLLQCDTYIVLMVLILILSLLLYFLRSSILRKKNVASRLGGVIDYEFL